MKALKNKLQKENEEREAAELALKQARDLELKKKTDAAEAERARLQKEKDEAEARLKQKLFDQDEAERRAIELKRKRD